MSAGFGGQGKENRIGKDAKITIDLDYIDVLLKKYKKIKKYQKSPYYTVKNMDGTEKIINSLIQEAQENPL